MHDSSKDARESQSARKPLIEKFDPRATLIKMIGEIPTPLSKRVAASVLAKTVGRNSHFSISYIENVHSGKWKPGVTGKFYAALRAVWEHQQGGHPIMGAYAPVEVWVIRENIPPNSLILGKATNCHYCGIPFVGVVHNQKFCCEKHRKDFRKEKR